MNMKLKYILNSNPAKIGLFLLTLFYTLWRLFKGLDFADSFFFLNTEFADFTMAEGLAVVVRLISNVFGKELYVYRLFFWILTVLSLLFPYLMLQKKDKWIYNLHYLFLGLICVTTFPPFEPNVFTTLLFSLGLTFFIKFIQTKNNYVYLVVLAVSAAVSVFFRFPNILLFPAIILLLFLIPFFTEEKKWKIKDVLKIEFLFIITYLFVFVVIMLLLFGTEYLEKIQLSINSATEKTHSINIMLSNIQRDFLKIVFYVAFCFLMREFCRYYDTIKKVKWNKIFIGAAIVLFFTYIVRYDMTGSMFIVPFRLFLSSSFLYLMISDVFKTNKNLLFYLSIISFAFVSVAGSDTGLVKILHIILCFQFFILLKTQFNASKNLIVLLLVVVLHLAVLGGFHRTFVDIKPHELTQTVQVDNLKYIKTTPERAAFIENVVAEYYKLKNDSTKIVFYGRDTHIFRYVTNVKPIYKSNYTMGSYLDIIELKNVILEHYPVVFHIPCHPEVYSSGLNTTLDSMLLKENYSEIIRDKYKIFVPN